MKFLHTADWHLGKKLNGHSRHPEQVEVLDEICRIAEEQAVDLVLIAGDLFDNSNPSIESTELFYKTLRRLSADGSRAVIAIAGNHDSPERIAAPDPLARACGIVLVGFPDSQIPDFQTEKGIRVLQSQPGFVELSLPGVKFPVRLILTAFANEVRLRKYLDPDNSELTLRKLLQDSWAKTAGDFCDKQGVNFLMTHLYIVPEFGDAEPESDDERSIVNLGGAEAILSGSIPEQIQYAALGHIHKHWKVASKPCPVVYSSSPLCYSFSEAGQQKYVVTGNAEPGKPIEYEKVELTSGRPVLRKAFENQDEAIVWLEQNPDALVELTIISDSYLSAESTRRLYGVHSGIVDLIPQVKNQDLLQTESGHSVDLSLDKTSLFKSFFLHQKGQEPSEELIKIFEEVLKDE